MRQAICIKFPAALSSNMQKLILLDSSAGNEFMGRSPKSSRVCTNVRVNGRNLKFIGTFDNLKQLLRSLKCTS